MFMYGHLSIGLYHLCGERNKFGESHVLQSKTEGMIFFLHAIVTYMSSQCF